jgi:nucleotide-binding universal stress UspA family protein
MIERVVVPVDFTAESDRAIVTASRLATWAGTAVELVTVVEPERADALARLAEVGRLGDSMTCRVVETEGSVAAALLNELHRSEKELWCVGSHARGALWEMLLHSLSEDLVRTSHVPVALVGPHATTAPSGRVMAIAVDGTKQSEAILSAAAELSGALGMSLRLLQVAEADAEAMPSDATGAGYLSQVAGRIPAIDHDAVDYDILHGGHPAHNIADYVADHPEIGMVALLETRGLSGRARLLHGSTAFDLAHRATVPVLIHHAV